MAAAPAAKRAVMTLYAAPASPFGHCIRMVMSEKGIVADFQSVKHNEPPGEFMELNPYGAVPLLVDRDLVLYNTQIICEYLDERFPHPPLMPVDPVARATARLAILRVHRDWYPLLEELETGDAKHAGRARKDLRDSLMASLPVFGAKKYFLNDEFTLVDCAVAPVLWRLNYYEVDLPRQAKPIADYAANVFARPAFKGALNETEMEMRL
jgi:RNA polymerase-associated protein